MIYIIWEMEDELVPSLTAFTNKAEFTKWVKRCEKLCQKADEEGQNLYRYGCWSIPWTRSKKDLCHNINHTTLSEILLERSN